MFNLEGGSYAAPITQSDNEPGGTLLLAGYQKASASLRQARDLATRRGS